MPNTLSVELLGTMHAQLVDAVRVVMGEQPTQCSRALLALEATYAANEGRLLRGPGCPLSDPGRMLVDGPPCAEQQTAELIDACTALVVYFTTVVGPFFQRCSGAIAAHDARLRALQSQWRADAGIRHRLASRHYAHRRFLNEHHPHLLRAVCGGGIGDLSLPPPTTTLSRSLGSSVCAVPLPDTPMSLVVAAVHPGSGPPPPREELLQVVTEHLRARRSVGLLDNAMATAASAATERLALVDALQTSIDALSKRLLRDLAERTTRIREQSSDVHDAMRSRLLSKDPFTPLTAA